MTLTDRQQKFLEFVKESHGSQLRKYTNEPYWTHPYAVAEIVSQYDIGELAIEGALGHDLLEDTKVTVSELLDKLILFGYAPMEVLAIIQTITSLTDQFTPENYTKINRAARKKLEAARMSLMSSHVQSIKCADLIHNTSSIVEHDQNFARTYLREKRELLDAMVNANVDIRQRAYDTHEEAFKKITA